MLPRLHKEQVEVVAAGDDPIGICRDKQNAPMVAFEAADLLVDT